MKLTSAKPSLILTRTHIYTHSTSSLRSANTLMSRFSSLTDRFLSLTDRFLLLTDSTWVNQVTSIHEQLNLSFLFSEEIDWQQRLPQDLINEKWLLRYEHILALLSMRLNTLYFTNWALSSHSKSDCIVLTSSFLWNQVQWKQINFLALINLFVFLNLSHSKEGWYEYSVTLSSQNSSQFKCSFSAQFSTMIKLQLSFFFNISLPHSHFTSLGFAVDRDNSKWWSDVLVLNDTSVNLTLTVLFAVCVQSAASIRLKDSHAVSSDLTFVVTEILHQTVIVFSDDEASSQTDEGCKNSEKKHVSHHFNSLNSLESLSFVSGVEYVCLTVLAMKEEEQKNWKLSWQMLYLWGWLYDCMISQGYWWKRLLSETDSCFL